MGDGSLTKRKNRNAVMLSFTHCQVQLDWLQTKANRLNNIFGRKCVVSSDSYFDSRTNKIYHRCQYSMTSKVFLPLYEIAYPNGKKLFTEELLDGLTEEHLAVLWADDGNLEPKNRIGRLNLYVPEQECNVVNEWISNLTGAVGRYEDYEKQGFGRLRYPASQMVKIAKAIKPYLHQSMLYKIDMQYKSNTKARLILAASSPNNELPTIESLPQVSEQTAKQWQALAKKVGLSFCNHGTKEQLRARIVETLQFISGQ